uniref:Uncharacterized protein n=1 Tax=Pectobacterium carotovorum TaxID=554 RepID=A0A0N9MZ51_PECCA|nr:hypothetical protein [Pectobacterium carotovorum]ALG88597.1 putative protein YihA [Pectobacterium carotovorum]
MTFFKGFFKKKAVPKKTVNAYDGVKKHLFALVVNYSMRENDKDGGMPEFIGEFDGVSALPKAYRYPFVYCWLDKSNNNMLVLSFNDKDIRFYCSAVIDSLKMCDEYNDLEGVIDDVINDFNRCTSDAFHETIVRLHTK